ncbi:DNA polymerase III subunit gamma/tau [Candidatus Dependentiae bacterium]|nr:DNA polymerase III subunit gamma/tau [Candidatus Dependentiae bacterium]
MEQKNNLNLARKWRPKNFKEIVGQDIPIKMLLNSLYLEKLFPVYLFAGQRGCGKTSSARVFGAAINCKNIDLFRNNPKDNPIPCQKCDSCKSMAIGNHPDFIEIDAASHTGVENVRQILESCSYMPILGNKKIYLIDEAHMLSKAAFNAFLKILEEPPSSALFILATTEIQKFPATVLSRCFQLIFKAINNKNLKEYIKNICKKEEVNIEDNAIDILIQETEGSVRDAINMLERVRFSETTITTESILKVLGKVSEKEILDLFEIIIDQDPKKLIHTLNSKTFENVDPSILWNMILETLRATLWINFKTEVLPSYFNNKKRLEEIAAKTSLNRLNAIFQLFWTQEDIFLKTPNKKILLETILLQICQQINILDIEDLLKNKTIESTKTNNTTNKEFNTASSPQSNSKNNSENNIASPQTKPTANKTFEKKTSVNVDNNWKAFLNKLSQSNSPFLMSILSQAKFIKFNNENKLVQISLLNDNAFTQETIKEHQKDWLPILKEFYPGVINFEFIKKKHPIQSKPIENKINTNNQAIVNKAVSPKPLQTKQNYQYRNNNSKNYLGPIIDVSDKEKWPKANLIKKFFPGKIRKA